MAPNLAIMAAIEENNCTRRPESWSSRSTLPGFFAFMDRNRRQGTATTRDAEMPSSPGCSVSVRVRGEMIEMDVRYCRFQISQFLRYWLPGWLADLIMSGLPDWLALKLVPSGD